MVDFLSTPGMGVFFAGLGVTLLLCLVEGASLAFAGTTTPSFMDFDDGEHPASGPLGYLNAGRLPLTLFVATASAMFGLMGIGLQHGAITAMSAPLPLLAAIPIAAIAATPATHFVTRGLGALMPRTETTAISGEDLIGREGVVMAGMGKRGLPVQVRLRDEFGQAHYLMVEPTRDDETLNQGQKVILTNREGPLYFAILSANQSQLES
jgi:membrane protein implicated in regulation of membrane protease activity